jgi:hypothetical protein
VTRASAEKLLTRSEALAQTQGLPRGVKVWLAVLGVVVILSIVWWTRPWKPAPLPPVLGYIDRPAPTPPPKSHPPKAPAHQP